MENIGWVATGAKATGPYCAAFVKMILNEVSSGAANQFFKNNTSFLAQDIFNKLSKNNDYSEKISSPEIGCLCCYSHHIEFVENTDGKTNTVISANSFFADNKTEGIVRKQRKASTSIDNSNVFLGYIRIKKIS